MSANSTAAEAGAGLKRSHEESQQPRSSSPQRSPHWKKGLVDRQRIPEDQHPADATSFGNQARSNGPIAGASFSDGHATANSCLEESTCRMSPAKRGRSAELTSNKKSVRDFGVHSRHTAVEYEHMDICGQPQDPRHDCPASKAVASACPSHESAAPLGVPALEMLCQVASSQPLVVLGNPEPDATQTGRRPKRPAGLQPLDLSAGQLAPQRGRPNPTQVARSPNGSTRTLSPTGQDWPRPPMDQSTSPQPRLNSPPRLPPTKVLLSYVRDRSTSPTAGGAGRGLQSPSRTASMSPTARNAAMSPTGLSSRAGGTALSPTARGAASLVQSPFFSHGPHAALSPTARGAAEALEAPSSPPPTGRASVPLRSPRGALEAMQPSARASPTAAATKVAFGVRGREGLAGLVLAQGAQVEGQAIITSPRPDHPVQLRHKPAMSQSPGAPAKAPGMRSLPISPSGPGKESSKQLDQGGSFLFPRGPDSPQYTLVLDLDQVLVHSSLRPLPNADFTLTIGSPGEGQQQLCYVKKRPMLDFFLQCMNDQFELVAFTASRGAHADALLQKLDPNRQFFSGRLPLSACSSVNGQYVKNLSALGRDLSKIVLVDSEQNTSGTYKANTVLLRPWYGNNTDGELWVLVDQLRELLNHDDVRPGVAKMNEHRAVVVIED